MAQGLWGVEVRALATGRVLYARNPYSLMMPASNMKILTLAAAAETLGWDYRFKTTLETAGAISRGVLTGDLVVHGTGDPTINARANRASALFDEWAAALRAAGVTRVDGRILADARAFDDRWLGAGWSWDYLQDGYAAPAGALELNEDTARLAIQAGPKPGDPLAVELTAGAGLRLVNHTVTGDAGSPSTLAFERASDEPVLLVTGALALDAKPAQRDVAVVNPAAYFAQGLKDALGARGIPVSGQALDAAGLASETTSNCEKSSSNLCHRAARHCLTVMMKVSQNLYAETLLKAVCAAHGAVGTAEAGRNAARTLFISWGVRRLRPGRRFWIVALRLRHGRHAGDDPGAPLQDPRHHDAFLATLPSPDRTERSPLADEADARRRQCPRQNRFDLERAHALGLRQDARRRDAGLLDPRQQLTIRRQPSTGSPTAPSSACPIIGR